MKILLTGVAGFIGYHLAKRIDPIRHDITGIDNVSPYYSQTLKRARLADLGVSPVAPSAAASVSSPRIRFAEMDICAKADVMAIVEDVQPDVIVHLAAQPGVRYSLEDPDAYIASNIQGTLNLFEAARQYPVEHFVYASSSSVYGLDSIMPLSESTAADHPASLYAVSKRSNELMAHSYSHLYGIPTTGLRFFTVYGPWGRPDMAPMLFAKAILEGRPIKVFNNGNMSRDFTYVEDIVQGIINVLSKPATPVSDWDGKQSGVSTVPARVYNIGRGSPVSLMDFIETLEQKLGRKAQKQYLPMQPGDIAATWADCSRLEQDFGYTPTTSLTDGIERFARWYRDYYEV